MDAYVEHFDKAELTLQRRVELANAHLKQFKCLGTIYRKGAVRAFRDLEIIGVVVAKLVFVDLLLNQEHSGYVHMTGPTPDPVRVFHVPVVGPGARLRVAKRPRTAPRSRRSGNARKNALNLVKRPRV